MDYVGLVLVVIILLVFMGDTSYYTKEEVPDFKTPKETSEDKNIRELRALNQQLKEAKRVRYTKDLRQRIGFSPYLSNMYATKQEKLEYLQSDFWHKLRIEVINRDKVCVCCNNPGTEIHHLHYKELCDDEPSNLVLLCRSCHQLQHDIYGYKRETDYSNLVKIIDGKLKIEKPNFPQY